MFDGSRKLIVCLLVIAALGVFAAPSTGATYRVRAGKNADGDWVWKPNFRHIEPGNRIKWTNPTGKRHSVTAYGGGWSKDVTLSPDEVTYKKFNSEGVYRYRCKFHSSVSNGSCSGMCGIIHVAN